MISLETNRLILRKYRVDDFTVVHSYGSDVENIIYMLFDINTKERTEEYINNAIQNAEADPITDYNFAAELKDGNRLIGGCTLAITDNEAEIGWLIQKDYWNQGFGTEMAYELLRFGFDELNLHRILAHCDSENIASYKIMEKIGMRLEGLFWEARPPHKHSKRVYSDELAYAILKDEWEIQKEIAYYKSLPVVFNDFVDVPVLDDGIIRMVCIAKKPADPVKKWIPAYIFAICKGSERVGDLSLRIGYGGSDHDCNCYYGGQIGYNIDEKYRGNGYAGRAVKLVLPIAKAHNFSKLLITTNESNTASMRVCEKLGARLVRVARLPEWTELYQLGNRYQNIYELSIE